MPKRLLPAAASLALLLCLSASAARAQTTRAGRVPELSYTLEPVFGNDALRFRVELSFKGDAGGTTRLVLPDRWGGQQNLYRAVSNLRVSPPDARLSDTAEPHVKTVAHGPNATLRVRYELAQDFAGDPQNETRYRPALHKDYFHWIGHGVWVRPDWDEQTAVSVSLRWEGLPKSWALASSFGVNERRQRFRATVEEFVHAVYVGGDFRLMSLRVGGKAVNAAVRGAWQFSDEAFADMVRRVVAVERAFWRDHDVPFYLVTLIPLEAPPNVTNTGGTGLTNSFALFSSRNAELGDFKWLLAHEYFHNWNSPKLGRLKEPESQLYWFSEGFTDFYAYLLALRGGLITLDEYIGRYNALMREYYLLPVRAETNERVVKDFWNDDDVRKLPYRRGLLLATNWNALIRAASGGRHSLDDVMLAMFDAARGGRPELTAEVIGEHVRRLAGRDVTADIKRHVEAGELIAPAADAFGPHVELEVVEVAPFELGLDLETLRRDKIIAGVKEDSAAHRAGLRDGQVVVRRLPIHLGDATKPVEITIKEGAGERTIKFYPASANTVGVPRYKLRPGSGDAGRAETLRLLGVAAQEGKR